VDDVGIQLEVREQVVGESPRDRHCAVRQDASGDDDCEPSWRTQDRIWTRGALWCRWRLGGSGEDLRGVIAGDLVTTRQVCQRGRTGKQPYPPSARIVALKVMEAGVVRRAIVGDREGAVIDVQSSDLAG